MSLFIINNNIMVMFISVADIRTDEEERQKKEEERRYFSKGNRARNHVKGVKREDEEMN